ncbi:MAG: SPOR domain-containing protein [Rubricoccaceae bacterium]|nr:SPOR domain-containing protein [Rubricoccaceae bacterium]
MLELNRPSNSPESDSSETEAPQKRWVVRPGWQAWTAVVGVLWFAVVAGLFSGVMLHEIENGNGNESTAAAAPMAMLASLDSMAPDSVEAEGPGFTVQVGVFEKYENAEQLAEALHGQYDRVRLEKRSPDLYVVSLGPFEERTVAIETAQHVKAEMDISPVIHEATSTGIHVEASPELARSLNADSEAVTSPSEVPASIETPIETARSGFMVQVGVFRKYANAEQLAEGLRSDHDRVHLEQRPPDLYVVSLGPFEDWAVAMRLVDRE